tara:strand:- start:171 stop:737 length:567 start_codon:yes stop_codon:yes gene_type:complete
MATLEDNSFDLAVVDPPYGIGISKNPVRQKHEKKEWDSFIPCVQYFKELKRVSKNQIIWGGNYFLDYLDNTQCFLIWNKLQPFDFSLAMCEMAWTNFSKPAKMFTQSVHKERNKIHPTQKPVQLYQWIFDKYAKKDWRILDTHLGSGSSAIAAHDSGLGFVGIELDADYFKAAKERLETHQQQLRLFT